MFTGDSAAGTNDMIGTSMSTKSMSADTTQQWCGHFGIFKSWYEHCVVS